MAANDRLASLMQTLPQELFDKIYDDVFTADGIERVIDKKYKPPPQLQVDRASRKMFAASYYGNGAAFTFPSGVQRKWLESLPTQHFNKIDRFERWMRKSTHPELHFTVDHERKRMERRRLFISMLKHGYQQWTMTDRGDCVEHFCLERNQQGDPGVKWHERIDEEVQEGWFWMVWTKLSV